MKEITFSVRHKDIVDRIKLYTHYTGEARRNAGLPDKQAAAMQASADDATQMSDHIENALNEVGTILSRYFAQFLAGQNVEDGNEENKEYTFTIAAPELFPSTATANVEKCIENLVVRRTLQQWFVQHRPEEATLQAAEAQNAAGHLRELLTLRSRPRIKCVNSNGNINL